MLKLFTIITCEVDVPGSDLIVGVATGGTCTIGAGKVIVGF